jgi:hypothetical protein
MLLKSQDEVAQACDTIARTNNKRFCVRKIKFNSKHLKAHTYGKSFYCCIKVASNSQKNPTTILPELFRVVRILGVSPFGSVVPKNFILGIRKNFIIRNRLFQPNFIESNDVRPRCILQVLLLYYINNL